MIKYGGGFTKTPWLKHGFDDLWSLYIPFHSIYSFFLSFSLINPFSVCFFCPLDYHYIICSIHYRTSRAWTDKTHQYWKNELWICSVSVYYLLFHLRYLLKQRPFSANHNVPMWPCNKEAMMRPSVQGNGFCSHYSLSLKITHSVCKPGYCFGVMLCLMSGIPTCISSQMFLSK